MLINIILVIATFTAPENIGTTLLSLFWMLPLTLAIAVGYKATKLPKIETKSFVKESVVLFGSILIFLVVTAVVLYVFAWLTL